MEFLSVMSKGSTQEKILWSFEFLDIDKNGYISKQEMVKVGRKYFKSLTRLCQNPESL